MFNRCFGSKQMPVNNCCMPVNNCCKPVEECCVTEPTVNKCVEESVYHEVNQE